MEFKVVRFNELKRYLKNVSDKTLSSNLKELEADRLIIRKEYPQIPPKVEYSLSGRGQSLMGVLDQLCVWGENNRDLNELDVPSVLLFQKIMKKSLITA